MKSKIFIGIIAGIAIILSAISICMNISEIVVSDISLVLGFIGVLATFIVVSNSVQLWQVEKQIEEQSNIVQEIKQNTDAKIQNQNTKLEDVSNSNKSIQTFVEEQQATQYSNWNNMKRIILTFVHMEYQYLKDESHSDKVNHADLAFLYMIDIVPLLTYLYGKNGEKTDASGDTLAVIIGIFSKILNNASKNSSLRISKKNLNKCLKYFEQYLPDSYFKLESVKNVVNEIKKYIECYAK